MEMSNREFLEVIGIIFFVVIIFAFGINISNYLDYRLERIKFETCVEDVNLPKNDRRECYR